MRICFVCLGNICRSPTAEAIKKLGYREFARADYKGNKVLVFERHVPHAVTHIPPDRTAGS